MRNFGFAGYDSVVCIGTNAKMTEVCAAMGLTSFETMREIITINRKNYDGYAAGLQGLSGLRLVQYDPSEENNYQYVVIEVDPSLAPLNRDELVSVLHAENLLARKYFWPGCHKMEPYLSLQPNSGFLLPNTERLTERVIVLPSGQAVSTETVAKICEVIWTAFENADALRAAFCGTIETR
jgi:dTDP-4-amino-4,6-dideoxygalactose transaminase